jgi:site-specific recombinase XerD
VQRHLEHKIYWRLVKKYCEAAGIDSSRLGVCGIGIHSQRKTPIAHAIRDGSTMDEVCEFTGHTDIQTAELYFVHGEGDAGIATAVR